MPPLDERLALAERTMVALVADAELPPKIAVHPRPEGSFGHAMPAHLRGATPDGGDDLVGMKWIAGFPENRARGLPALHGLVLLGDPTTGVPTAILDAGPITAERTAAVSGVAIARFAPRDRGPPAACRADRRGCAGPEPPRGASAGCCRARCSRSSIVTGPSGGARRGGARDAGHRPARACTRAPARRSRRPTSSSPPRRSVRSDR